MPTSTRSILGLGAVVAAVLIAERRHASQANDGGPPTSHAVVNHSAIYGATSRYLLASFYRGVAASIDSEVATGRILDVGCGPGHLAIALAARHDRDVTATDLDPAMIAQARSQVSRRPIHGGRTPSFEVADVTALPYPDDSFELVVSTLSMHHWEDLTAAFKEISRVLKPDGHVLIWDFRPGSILHRHTPNPQAPISSSGLVPVSVTPWHWPWKLTPTQRMALRP